MQRTRFRVLSAIMVVCVITIIFHVIGWLTGIEEFTRRLIHPSSAALYEWSSTIGNKETFQSTEELEQAYTALKQKYIDRQVDEATLVLLQEENDQLKQQLQFVQETSEVQGAKVIGKNIDPVSSSIVVNIGEQQGIAIGDIVTTGNGILVGMISEVHQHSSIVRLINDNQSKVGATVINTDRSIGVIEGGFGINIHMRFIPQNEKISPGDIIVTSGLGENMPRGLVIGQVESVKKEAYKPFQEAVISPLVDLNKLFIVSVIHSENTYVEVDS